MLRPFVGIFQWASGIVVFSGYAEIDVFLIKWCLLTQYVRVNVKE
jgi:hypothetical protein